MTFKNHLRSLKGLLALAGVLSIFAVVNPVLGATQRSASAQHAMGSIPCSWGVPVTGHGNSLDVKTTIRDLKENGFNCYVQVLWKAPPYSFEDLKRLLPAAQSAGISIWSVLIPPSEGGNSLPYRTDYMTWMKTLARLSLKYPSLRGVNIDDLLDGKNPELFTHAYLGRLYEAKQRINPKLLFVPTVYELDRPVVDRLEGCVDGVWLWWVNLESDTGLRSFLANSRLAVAGRFPIYSGVYASSTSWHKEGNPSPALLKHALEIACTHADGAIIWELPLGSASAGNPLLEAARAFAAGGSSNLAGKCGLGSAKE